MTVRPTASSRGVLYPGDVAGRVDLRRYPAGGALGRYVERYWAVHWDLAGHPPYTVELVPHPCVNLTVTAEGGGQVHGVGTTRSSHPLAGTGSVFGVKFRPGGFSAFTGVAASSLTDRSVPLREFFGPPADRLADAVLAAGDDRRRIELFDRFLGDRQVRPPPGREHQYDLLLRVVARMLTDRTVTRVDRAAAGHGLSVRSLQRLFHRYVGVGPKWVIRRYRMHDGAERLARGDVDPASLAVELGWFDQAHFTREFTSLIGTTPVEYAAACAAAADREPPLVAAVAGAGGA